MKGVFGLTCYAYTGADVIVDGAEYTVSFFRVPDRRGERTITVCVITTKDGNEVASASSSLHWRDTFDLGIGRAVALGHATKVLFGKSNSSRASRKRMADGVRAAGLLPE